MKRSLSLLALLLCLGLLAGCSSNDGNQLSGTLTEKSPSSEEETAPEPEEVPEDASESESEPEPAPEPEPVRRPPPTTEGFEVLERIYDRPVADFGWTLGFASFAMGDSFYYFYGEESFTFHRFQPATMEESSVELTELNGKKFIGVWPWREGVIVGTDEAVYGYDRSLHLVRQASWPTAFREQIGSHDLFDEIIIAPGMDRFAFSDMANGFYVCDFGENAVPRMIAAHPLRNPEREIEDEAYRPRYFLDDERMVVRKVGWEWLVSDCVLNLEGELLAEIDFIAHGYGLGLSLWTDTYLLALNPMPEAYEGPYLFDFETMETRRLEQLGEALPTGDLYDYQHSIREAPAGKVLFTSNEGGMDSLNIERTDFYLIDLAAQSVEQLPIAVEHANAQILGITDDGYLLAAYPLESPQAVGLYKLP